jgi:chromosomal replication initiation ATPase DnaA
MGSIQDPVVFLAARRASLAQFIVAQVHGVPVQELRQPTRGRPHVARARQISIHLARRVFDLNHRQLAQEFGRDRSTVHHACGLIEKMRAENEQFDSTLTWMETLLRRAAGLTQ